MKVVQINQVSGYGSTGKIAERISDILDENGIENKILYAYYTSQHKNAIAFGNGFDKIQHKILSRITGRHGLYSKRGTEEVIEFLEKYKPDVIHLHNLHGYYINYKILFEYIKKNDIPLVMTLHDCWSFTGHCAHFDYVKCEKWKEGCFACEQKNQYPKTLRDASRENWLEKKKCFSSVKNCIIVTPSQWLADLVRKSFLRKYPVEVVANGIDLKLFNVGEKNVNRRKIVLANAPSLDANDRKGGGYLRKLAELLGEEYELWVLGVKKSYNNIPAGMKLLPYINNQAELVQIYSKANVFANCTLEDTFPTVNLESLACGTPVVTFDTGGSKECLTSTCGAVVPKEKIESMAEQIKIWANVDCAKACRDRAEKFEYRDRFSKYIDIYKAVIKK